MPSNASVNLVLLPGSATVLKLSAGKLRQLFVDADDSLVRHGKVKARKIGASYGISHETVYRYLRDREQIERALDVIEAAA